MEAEESGVQGHVWLHWEFKTSVLPFFFIPAFLPFPFSYWFLSIYTCFLYMVATETSTYKFHFKIWLTKCTISLNLQKSHKVWILVLSAYILILSSTLALLVDPLK